MLLLQYCIGMYYNHYYQFLLLQSDVLSNIQAASFHIYKLFFLFIKDKKYLKEKFDIEVKKEKQQVVELGGLRIIGTERHESRRIDNQLRGRAGRQGDPGSSVFYLSADDDLTRIFGGDRLKRMAELLKMDDDTSMNWKMFSRSVEGAQKTG